MKKKALFLIFFFAIILIIQLFRIDTTHPEIENNKDYLVINDIPQEIVNIIQNSCYDCHSYQTKYPWYSNIAPISWMINHHVKEGREHMNFSEWGNYSLEKRISLQEECIEELEESEMPLSSYTMIHSDAELSDDDMKNLLEWFNLQTREDEAN